MKANNSPAAIKISSAMLEQTRVFRSKREREAWEQSQQILGNFTEGITVMHGRKGTGKTTAAVGLLWNLRETFGMPVVCDFPLKEEFGVYTKIDINSFVTQIRLLGELTKGQSQEMSKVALSKYMENGMEDFETGEKKMLAIEGAAMLLDEAYTYMDSRSAQDKVVRLFGHWISQIRHFRTALIIVAPHMDMLDKRVNRQVDRTGTSFTDKESGSTFTRFHDLNTDEFFNIEWDSPKYWNMFDSWVKTPFRSTLLSGVKA